MSKQLLAFLQHPSVRRGDTTPPSDVMSLKTKFSPFTAITQNTALKVAGEGTQKPLTSHGAAIKVGDNKAKEGTDVRERTTLPPPIFSFPSRYP